MEAQLKLATHENEAWYPYGIVLDSVSSSTGLSPGGGHCVVFLSKTLYSHSGQLML